MENFNQQFTPEDESSTKVEEKSIYSLNLDGTRIAILSLIILAIITVTFLIGMKVSSSSDDFSSSENTIVNNVSETSGETDSLLPETNTLAPNQTAAAQTTDSDVTSDPLFEATNNSISSQDTSIDHSIAKIETEVKASKPKSISKKKSSIAKAQKKNERKLIVKNNNISKVRPTYAKVSSKDSFISAKSAKKIGFAIQVASFDSIAKANKEVQMLKLEKYDAYIDKTNVNGITFFRVKVGPVSTKSYAADLLDKISLEPRYAESFIVKEM